MTTTATLERTAQATETAAGRKPKAPTIGPGREKQEARSSRCDFCLQRGATEALVLDSNRLVACHDCAAAIARHDVRTLVQRAMKGGRLTEATHPGSTRRLTDDYGYLLRQVAKA